MNRQLQLQSSQISESVDAKSDENGNPVCCINAVHHACILHTQV